MNDIQRGITILLKSAITGQPMELPEGFSLDDAFDLIRLHQLIPIAYEGAVRCGIPKTMPVMRKMLQGYCQCAMINEAQMNMLERIFDAFDQNGIDYMPLKGCNMKALFPKPEMRQMGDADILIRTEQYDRIRPIIAEFGFEKQDESDHELVWHSRQLHLELHKRLIPTVHKDFYAYFGDGWRLAKKTEGSRYAMSPEDEFIYLFTHYAKHYRSGGIGCRHILDLWIHRRAYGDMDEEYIRGAMERLWLLEFYENTCNLIRFWFDTGIGDEKTEYMSDFIFNSGSWGGMENKFLSAQARSAKTAGSVQNARAKMILQTIFLPWDKLRYSYPILKKAPWLTPVFWPVRWVRVLLFRKENLQKKANALKDATSERVELYQQSLLFVGLDFYSEE